MRSSADAAHRPDRAEELDRSLQLGVLHADGQIQPIAVIAVCHGCDDAQDIFIEKPDGSKFFDILPCCRFVTVLPKILELLY